MVVFFVGGVGFCGGVVVFLWWCGVFAVVVLFFVVVWWCFCGGVVFLLVLFLWWCGGEDRHQRLPKVSAEVMAVLKDCHQRLPKVLCGGVFVVVFVWWCFCGGVLCGVFLWWCGGVLVVVFLWWCFLRWCFCGWCSESSAEVMAVLKDCHPRLPKVLLK